MHAMTAGDVGLLLYWAPRILGPLVSAYILKALWDYTMRGRVRHPWAIRALTRLADMFLYWIVRAAIPVGLLPRPGRVRVVLQPAR